MPAAALTSSTIAHAAYDRASRTLRLTFTNNHRYAYTDVPSALYDALISAPSAGAYFNDHIRDCFACTRADGRRTYPLDE